MKFLVYFSRIFVGSIFIVSGLIKANDALGFSYKLEEYFEDGALAYRIKEWFSWNSFSLESMMDSALGLAILMCILEIVLGFALIVGSRVKRVVIALLGLTVVFFFLTLHTATCDPMGTYTNAFEVQKDSPEHLVEMKRQEGNSSITLTEKDGNIVVSEKLGVQCVNDCGCFGDAMKGSLGRSLTPWESFSKDVILMVFLIPVFFYRKKIKVNTTTQDVYLLIGSAVLIGWLCWVFSWMFPLVFFLIGVLCYLGIKRFSDGGLFSEWGMLGVFTLMSFLFVGYTYRHLPVKDYRPYAVGKSIPDQMQLPEGAKPSVYENMFYYKNKTTGVVEEFTEKNYPWDDENYEFSDRQTKLIFQGDVAAITDFTMNAEDGNDYASDFFNEEIDVYVIVMHDLRKTNTALIKKCNEFAAKCLSEGGYVIAMSSSTHDMVEKFKKDHNFGLDFYSCDAVTLKTIVRGNPGMFVMRKGKIVGKWHANDIDSYESIIEQLQK